MWLTRLLIEHFLICFCTKALRICLLSLICLYLQQFLRCSSVNYHFRKLIISAIHTMIIFRLRYVDHLVSCVCWPWLLEIWRMSCYVKNWEKGVEIVYSAQNFILYGLSSFVIQIYLHLDCSYYNVKIVKTTWKYGADFALAFSCPVPYCVMNETHGSSSPFSRFIFHHEDYIPSCLAG